MKKVCFLDFFRGQKSGQISAKKCLFSSFPAFYQSYMEISTTLIFHASKWIADLNDLDVDLPFSAKMTLFRDSDGFEGSI